MAFQRFTCFLIGEGSLPIQCARQLVGAGHGIEGVISTDVELRQWAQSSALPLLAPGAQLGTALSARPFDYLFSINNSHIIRADVLSRPRLQSINYHDGPLPRYAGLHATSWALYAGERRHGITWHVMTEEIDGGDILVERAVDIDAGDTALTLNGKCYEAAIAAFAELIDALARGHARSRPQSRDARTYHGASARPPHGAVIAWDEEAARIDALCRALTFGPYPNRLGAPKLMVGGDFFLVERLRVGDPTTAPPGTLLALGDDGWVVAAADRAVVIERLATLDGEARALAALAARHRLRVGQPLPGCAPELGARIAELDGAAARHERFWVERLAAPEPLELPYRHGADDAAAGSDGARGHGAGNQAAPGDAAGDGGDDDEVTALPLTVDDRVLAAVQARGWRRDHFLYALFAVYLARVSGRERFDLGFWPLGLAARVGGLERLFAPWLTLSIALDEAAPFSSAYRAVHDEIGRCLERQVRARDLGARHPRLAALGAGVAPLVAIAEAGARGRGLTLDAGTPALVRCPRRLLDAGTLGRVRDHLQTLLAAIVDAPERPLHALPLLGADEHERVLQAWNATACPIPDGSVAELVARQAAHTPDAVAVVYVGATLTYTELMTRARGVARALRVRGVGPEQPVGVWVERSLDLVVALLGILEAGAAYLPLDLEQPAARLENLIADARPRAFVSRPALAARLPPLAVPVVYLDEDSPDIATPGVFKPDITTPDIAAANIPASAPTRYPDGLAYIQYTSGSTGQPKGVAISQRALVNLLDAMRATLAFSASDVLVAITAPTFDIAGLEIWLPLLCGARLVIAPAGTAFDARALAALVEASGATVLQATPGVWRALLDSGWRAPADLRALVGGEALAPELAAALTTRCAASWNVYGPTETTIWSTAQRLDGRARVTVGRPLANTRVYILDTRLNPLPAGVVGEVYIGGAGVARGYVNRPGLTAERFIADPFSQGGRLYKTGDIGLFLPSGELELIGRADEQVKLRGHRVEPGEIEALLAEAEGVGAARVVLREDVPGDRRLVAYLVARSPGSGDEQALPALRRRLEERLPRAMIPSAFVWLDRFPLTRNGKLDRRALPPPGPRSVVRSQPFVPAASASERLVAGLWCELLGVDRVGLRDDFFELGGSSLLATQLAARLGSARRYELPVGLFFRKTTVAALAQHLDALELAYAMQTRRPGSAAEPNEELERW